MSLILLNTGSLDNTIREFLLAQSPWVKGHYKILHNYGMRTREFVWAFLFQFSLASYILGAFFNETNTPFTRARGIIVYYPN